MFITTLLIELVGCVAVFASMAFFQEGQILERHRDWGLACKLMAFGAAAVSVGFVCFGGLGGLGSLRAAILIGPMLPLILMCAALFDQPNPEE